MSNPDDSLFDDFSDFNSDFSPDNNSDGNSDNNQSDDQDLFGGLGDLGGLGSFGSNVSDENPFFESESDFNVGSEQQELLAPMEETAEEFAGHDALGLPGAVSAATMSQPLTKKEKKARPVKEKKPRAPREPRDNEMNKVVLGVLLFFVLFFLGTNVYFLFKYSIGLGTIFFLLIFDLFAAGIIAVPLLFIRSGIKPTVYDIALAISLVAMILSCMLLWVRLADYGGDIKAKKFGVNIQVPNDPPTLPSKSQLPYTQSG